jgi:hypothetical protein
MSLLSQFYPSSSGGTVIDADNEALNYTGGVSINYTVLANGAIFADGLNGIVNARTSAAAGTISFPYPSSSTLIPTEPTLRAVESYSLGATVSLGAAWTGAPTLKKMVVGVFTGVGMSFAAGSQLTEFYAGSLASGAAAGFSFINCASLTTVRISALYTPTSAGTYANFNGCSLTAASVDSVLIALANGVLIYGTGTATYNLGGAGNAAPTAVGTAAKNFIISKGYTVITN